MSDEKIYALMFDRDGIDVGELHKFIKNSPEISNWWHHISSCYLIKSRLSPSRLADEMPADMQEKGCLIVEVNLNRSNGWLGERAWTWIRNQRS
jgi:hypothetical protein